MDIYLQAYAGVRLFDIRIAGVSQKDQGLGKEAQLKADHSAIKFKSEGTRVLKNLGKKTEVQTATLVGGEGVGVKGVGFRSSFSRPST